MVADVIVVGAGLAGLRCAIRLTQLGREVVLANPVREPRLLSRTLTTSACTSLLLGMAGNR